MIQFFIKKDKSFTLKEGRSIYIQLDKSKPDLVDTIYTGTWYVQGRTIFLNFQNASDAVNFGGCNRFFYHHKLFAKTQLIRRRSCADTNLMYIPVRYVKVKS